MRKKSSFFKKSIQYLDYSMYNCPVDINKIYMVKKKLIVNYKNLGPEVLEAVERKYPDGFENHIFKVSKGANDYFYAFTVDTIDASYLVKVNVEIDLDVDDFDDFGLSSQVNNTKMDNNYGDTDDTTGTDLEDD